MQARQACTEEKACTKDRGCQPIRSSDVSPFEAFSCSPAVAPPALLADIPLQVLESCAVPIACAEGAVGTSDLNRWAACRIASRCEPSLRTLKGRPERGILRGVGDAAWSLDIPRAVGP